MWVVRRSIRPVQADFVCLRLIWKINACREANFCHVWLFCSIRDRSFITLKFKFSYFRLKQAWHPIWCGYFWFVPNSTSWQFTIRNSESDKHTQQGNFCIAAISQAGQFSPSTLGWLLWLGTLSFRRLHSLVTLILASASLLLRTRHDHRPSSGHLWHRPVATSAATDHHFDQPKLHPGRSSSRQGHTYGTTLIRFFLGLPISEQLNVGPIRVLRCLIRWPTFQD